MATYRDAKGNAKNAPKSVEPNEKPDPQHFADFKAKVSAKRTLTVKAHQDIGLIGYAPGDDLDAEERMVAIPKGGIARIVRQDDKSWNQPAAVIANFLARGRIEIVADREFDAAAKDPDKHHTAIAMRNRQHELAKQARRAGGEASMEARMAAMQEEIDKLKKAA